MGDLVAEDGGNSVFAVGETEDAREDEDVAARDDEGVCFFGFVDDGHGPLGALLCHPRGWKQTLDDLAHEAGIWMIVWEDFALEFGEDGLIVGVTDGYFCLDRDDVEAPAVGDLYKCQWGRA